MGKPQYGGDGSGSSLQINGLNCGLTIPYHVVSECVGQRK